MVQRRKITVPGLALAALLGLGSAPQPALAASGPLDEAKLAGRDAASFPPADEDYFKGMDNGVALTPDEVKGRNMWLVWTGGDDRFWDLAHQPHLRRVRPAEDHLVASGAQVQPRQSLELSRPDQRALLRPADRARPGSLRPVARQAARRLPGGSVRQCREISGGRDRCARQEPSGRLLLRRADRYRGPAAVPQSRLRCRSGAQMGCQALLRGSELLPVQGLGAAIPRRACPAASAMSGRARSTRRPIPPTRNGRT